MPTALFSGTLLFSAFLLFCIEPLVAKMLLPLAGGVPAVWSTCLAFFQVTLLLGYVFSHVTLRRLAPRRQAVVYAALFPLALATLPVTLPRHPIEGHPALVVLGLLLRWVGVPFFVLSTLAPAVQRWFSATRATHAHDPYFLYAASNVGSLAALGAYPFLIEPAIDLDVQSRLLRVAFVVLGALLLGCVALMKGGGAPIAQAQSESIAWRRRLRWAVLAAVPSAYLVAVTTYVTTEVAPAPLLWAVPLAAYLASFVVVFARRRVVSHAAIARRLPFAALVGFLLVATGANEPEALVLGLHVGVFFVVAMYCHSEMAADRPPAPRLPEFYTWMSLGGAVGGAAVALGAPLVFKQPIEYPVCLLLALACRPSERAPRWTVAVVAVALVLAIAGAPLAARLSSRIAISAVLAAPLLVLFALDRWARVFAWSLAGVLLVRVVSPGAHGAVLVRERSFFGAFAVVRDATSTSLMHGNTMHGLQLLATPHTPTLYYATDGPVADVVALARESGETARVAVVGLGAGTLATYARPGESWRFFELDPAVVRIARDPTYFTYLADAFPGGADVVVGDARLELARSRRRYGLLVIDAFTSDSIPTHLLTREAFASYRTELAEGGLVAWHVSNRHLDLEPELAELARDAGWASAVREDPANRPDAAREAKVASTWVVMASAATELASLAAKGWRPLALRPGFRCWTDQRASIVTVWK